MSELLEELKKKSRLLTAQEKATLARFLSPAEEEMTEAALFYEIALVRLDSTFELPVRLGRPD